MALNDAVDWRTDLGGGTQVALIQAGTFRSDAGTLLGPVPYVLWRDWAGDEPDEDRRLLQALNCLLIETPAGRVLVETGIGERINDKGRAMRDYRGDPVVPAMEAAGFDPTTVDVVAMSHLHFDHAGGLLAAWEEGQPPRLLFPNARFVVGAEHWRRALKPHPRDRASFVPELQPLLEASGRLELVEGEHSQTLGKSVRFFFSDGHTPGLMLAEVGGVVFCADLIPGRFWVHLPITMGYDRWPEKLIDEKRVFLEDKLARDVRLFFTHDHDCALARVTRDERGRFGTADEQRELRGVPPYRQAGVA